MKFLVLSIILMIGGVLLYQRTAGITFSLLNDCYDQAKEQQLLNDSTIYTACSNNRNALEQMSICLESVQKEKFMAGIFYEMSGVKDKVKILVLSHNQLCPDKSIPIPTAELYL